MSINDESLIVVKPTLSLALVMMYDTQRLAKTVALMSRIVSYSRLTIGS